MNNTRTCICDGLEGLLPHLVIQVKLGRAACRRPNARSVLTALRKVKDLPYTTIATGHGPMLRLNLDELVQR